MAHVFQVDHEVTTSGSNEYVEIRFPNHVTITQVNIGGGGAFNATIYNRALTGSALTVESILESPDGDCWVILRYGVKHNYQVGDTVTIASSAVVGYNTSHVITQIQNSGEFITDQSFSAEDRNSSATATLAMPAATLPKYEVMPLTAAVSNVVRNTNPYNFVSKQKDLISVNEPQGKLYLLLSAAGTYYVSLRGEHT